MSEFVFIENNCSQNILNMGSKISFIILFVVGFFLLGWG